MLAIIFVYLRMNCSKTKKQRIKQLNRRVQVQASVSKCIMEGLLQHLGNSKASGTALKKKKKKSPKQPSACTYCPDH